MESSSGSIIVSKGIQNPFTLKVGKVFTGFGIGCGLGIGVGSSFNLGAIPVLNQMMVAARGASDAFSGVRGHVNRSLRMVGAKNIEAGIGCGVGFGHGWGVGLAMKPGVAHQIQSSLVQVATKAMMKFGLTPNLSTIAEGILPQSLEGDKTMTNDATTQSPFENIMQLATKTTDSISQDGNVKAAIKSSKRSLNSSYASRTEKVINSFLQSPLLESEGHETKNQVGHLKSENDVIQLVLKQQLALEKLREENETLRQILVEDFKVSPNKFKVSSYSGTTTYPCSDCFECRIKQRRDRRR